MNTLTADNALGYILAGNSVFTVTNGDQRFTYKVRRAPGNRDGRPWFVKVLTGNENDEEGSYRYLGCIWDNEDGYRFVHGRKSRISPEAPSARMFQRLWDALESGEWPEGVTVWRSSRCCACGRTLTDPESIRAGIGPICAARAML